MAPLSGGIALIVFAYGIVQKLVLFPLLLGQVGSGPSFHAHALRARVASGRIFAIFPLPTLYALVCGLLLIFIIHYLLRARGAARLFWGLLLLLGAANLVLTESFGGILFFAAGALFYLFASRIFKLRYLAPLVMVMALVLFLVTALRFSEARDMSPARLRFANWAQAGRLIAQAPLLGVGLGNYEAAVAPQVRPDEPTSIYAHNFFLQLAAEAGLPLFLLLAVVFLAFLKGILPAFLRAENALFASACVLLLCFSTFDVGIYFFAAGVGFVVAFSQVAATEGRPRPGHWLAAALPAALLLVHAVAAGRQQAGDFWLSRGDAGRAAGLYRAALKLDPTAYRAWLGLAHIAWQRGDRPQADLALRQVLAIHSGQPYANYLQSRLAWSGGDYWTALAAAARAAGNNPKNREYKRWHEVVQRNLAEPPALPGN